MQPVVPAGSGPTLEDVRSVSIVSVPSYPRGPVALSSSGRVAARKLRDFLYRFALEEEPHYRVALDELGEPPLPCPMDVSEWWAMFDRLVDEHPFTRLGATCVLENIGRERERSVTRSSTPRRF